MMNRAAQKKKIIAILAVALAFAAAVSLMKTDPVSADKKQWKKTVEFDSEGMLIRPEGYRKWMFVGAPVTPNDMNKGKAPFPEFHYVYINYRGYKEYSRTGKFPDGTVMVKELVSVGSKKAASGNGYFAGDYIGLEAAVKDSKRFKDEPGNWAYFSFTDPGKPVKDKAEAFPAAACNSCHDANAADDWVFTQYYPVLRAAKAGSKSGYMEKEGYEQKERKGYKY